MSDQVSLFDLDPLPEPVPQLVEIDIDPDEVRVAPIPTLMGPALQAALKFESQVKSNERARRMRPKTLAKLRCERCPWTDKLPPAEVPAACPGCSRTATLVLVRFVCR